MTKFRTLFAQSALAAVLAISVANVAHADISSMSASIGGHSGNGPSAGNNGGNGNNSTDSVGTSAPSSGEGPDAFTYDTKLPNKPRLPRLPRPRPCHGASCKVQTASADGKVCFYTGANFTGAHFCASIGTSAPRLPATWNDRISSVEVIGPASVKICSDRAYSGECLALSGSRGMLISLDKAISSYTVTR
ncbi:peptidase inhibitor family I36 protein [Rhizobium sp. C4]|uniref:peptidase inhibitor family I36 protein n=1 Tax=Rhizobium sp. C4 TaxID=1349800 RepID=UPI001E3FACDC|nr:peptidase inhibitor family I36 protein [Rhizobium sp. C4]MCD2174053.1 peptidase inhibitor family I36 protein [Rhizobium sp. C4]